ncbi:MAG: ribosome-associated translation inhibitor RaiA [Gammaproteobacteria bacterium]|nr:MAG: ribosome-associated translation inhibitor RaiA [Gammaproteobacteria bacterium]
MQIDVTGQHIDVTPALRDHVANKFQKLKRHYDQVGIVHVVLKVEKLRQIAEATTQLEGNNFYAEAETEDMYGTIDALVSKLERQIQKHKGKTNDHRV